MGHNTSGEKGREACPIFPEFLNKGGRREKWGGLAELKVSLWHSSTTPLSGKRLFLPVEGGRKVKKGKKRIGKATGKGCETEMRISKKEVPVII